MADPLCSPASLRKISLFPSQTLCSPASLAGEPRGSAIWLFLDSLFSLNIPPNGGPPLFPSQSEVCRALLADMQGFFWRICCKVYFAGVQSSFGGYFRLFQKNQCVWFPHHQQFCCHLRHQIFSQVSITTMACSKLSSMLTFKYDQLTITNISQKFLRVVTVVASCLFQNIYLLKLCCPIHHQFFRNVSIVLMACSKLISKLAVRTILSCTCEGAVALFSSSRTITNISQKVLHAVT